MNATVRAATLADYEGICAVYKDGDAYHRADLPEVFAEYEVAARSFEYLRDVLQDERSRLWVAERDGVIAGILLMQLREPRPLPFLVARRIAYIDSLVVLAGYRRQGIGHALMQRAHAQAREWQADCVELTVWEFNRAAHCFYSALGYQLARRHLWLPLTKG